MGAEQPNITSAVSGLDWLKEACDRNVPVEVFRCTDLGSRPPARGRLLHLDNEVLVIEKLQVIGSTYELTGGTPLEGYFRFGGELFRFETLVKESRIAARLNGRLVVPALKVDRPSEVEPGQRRGVYRVSLGARTDAPTVELWTAARPGLPVPEGAAPPQDGGLSGDSLDPAAESAGALAPGESDALAGSSVFQGRVVDASDTGLGVLLHRCIYTRLKLMQDVEVRLRFAGDAEPTVFLATVRHTTPVREIDARVGLRLIDDGSSMHARKVRRITAYLTRVQREQRR